jgi:hypothetical protein
LLVADPQQLQHGVTEEESPIGGTLAGVHIARSFGDPEGHQTISLGRPDAGEDEQVI